MVVCSIRQRTPWPTSARAPAGQAMSSCSISRAGRGSFGWAVVATGPHGSRYDGGGLAASPTRAHAHDPRAPTQLAGGHHLALQGALLAPPAALRVHDQRAVTGIGQAAGALGRGLDG